MDQEESSTEQDLAALRAQIDQLGADLASITRTVKSIAGNVEDEAAAKVRSAVGDVRASARRAGEAVAAEVGERPLTSLILAFIVGLVLGGLFSRRT